MCWLIGASFILVAFVLVFSPKAATKLLGPLIGIIFVIWISGWALDVLAFRVDGSPGKLLIPFAVICPMAYAIRKARNKQHDAVHKAVERVPLMPSYSENYNHEIDNVDVGPNS
jgi:fatty acid desaturase